MLYPAELQALGRGRGTNPLQSSLKTEALQIAQIALSTDRFEKAAGRTIKPSNSKEIYFRGQSRTHYSLVKDPLFSQLLKHQLINRMGFLIHTSHEGVQFLKGITHKITIFDISRIHPNI